jgi:hypothetical protein
MFLELTLCCKMNFVKEPLSLLSKNLNLHITVVLKDSFDIEVKLLVATCHEHSFGECC